jgi:pimeloyl-ACP methyl ester carboxylesterase
MVTDATATTSEPRTATLDLGDAVLTYDVYGPLPPADGRPALIGIGQPMPAAGFVTLASLLADRTVISYDPRGLARSTRSDGREDNDPAQQADDLHALVQALDLGPVEVFGSSGGAITGLAWVTRHPNDIVTLVAHEPPLMDVLPDADLARTAFRSVQDTYERSGQSAGMAAFIAMTSWSGEFPPDVASWPPPDPAMFGMPAGDDGSRDNPLLSHASDAVSGYVLDRNALAAAATRVVIAAGEDSGVNFTGRTSAATASALGLELTLFPGGHGGFLGGEFGQQGKPEEFAVKLREVLDADSS